MLDYNIKQLTEAYRSLHFHPLPSDAFTFERKRDGLLMFHAPFNGSLSMEFLLEDAAKWDEDVAERLAEALERLSG